MQYGLGSTEQCGIQTLNIISDDGGGSTIHARDNIISKEEITIKTLDDKTLLIKYSKQFGTIYPSFYIDKTTKLANMAYLNKKQLNRIFFSE
jgi:hypothetical protein